ncbi:MAG TPA: cbb3-type cytochrome c oxidase subunit I [Opitutus sp.]|nr:cbb3-type cytochrome c oxidase subunit I [Opitutus sp.]
MPAIHPASTEVSEIDSSARGPLSLLLASALGWLVVSGVLALLHFAQTLSPSFLADCSWFTYGRMRGLQETAFIYGWVANSGYAVAIWILGRLGGGPLRSLNWLTVGAVFWNAAVLVGLIGISLGDGTATPFLRVPHYVQLLLLVSSGAIALPGVLAWTGRGRARTFAAQWYAVAALFLFPWVFSAAQLMLVHFPVRGTLQAIAAGWFAQSLWTLWVAPLALAAAYYLVPKITGRILPSYDFASLGFWTLLVVGGWTGGRHLIGGPVPAWVPTIAIVSCAMLVFHYIVVALNLRHAFAGRGSVTLKFVAFGIVAYLLGGMIDAVVSLRGIAQATQFTWLTQAISQLAISGAFTLTIFGAIYFLVPRIANQPWPSAGLIRAHFAAALLGFAALILGLTVAGIVQGRDLNDAAVPFADIAAHTRPWLLVATAGQAVMLVGHLILAFHFARLLASKPAATAADLFRQPPTMEASVS